MIKVAITIQRGGIYLIDFGMEREGSIQSGLRPGIIIQNNVGNQFSSTTIAIPCSTVSRSNLPVHVLLNQNGIEDGILLKDSIILCEQIRVINTYSMGRLNCSVKPEIMDEIEQAVQLSLGMSIKPKIKVLL